MRLSRWGPVYRNMSAPLLPSAFFTASRGGGGGSFLAVPLAAIQDVPFATSRKILDRLALLIERDGRTRFSGTLETCRDKTSSPGQVAQKVVENRTPDVSAPLSTEGRLPKLTLKNPAQKRAWMLALPTKKFVLPEVPPPYFSGLH